MDNPIEANSDLELAAAQEEGMRNTHENFRCRITVLRKEFREELYCQYPYGAAAPCGRLEEGQVFVTDNRWDPPEGFCLWAWGGPAGKHIEHSRGAPGDHDCMLHGWIAPRYFQA